MAEVNGGSMQAPTIGIARLLGEGSRFVVPEHQRDYSWTEDEIEQLLEDITNAQAVGQREYFLGLMVFLSRETREYGILDGQQRLATTTIILAAIRSWLTARGLSTDAHQVQSRYIAERALGSSDFAPRLVLNQANHPLFERLVVKEAPLADVQQELESLSRYDPSRHLLDAVIFCRTAIDGMAANGGVQRLYDLVAYLEDNIKVVRLIVPSEANAYTVFETLNDRGLDLSVLDLVKNYLFGKAENPARLREVQTRWTQMIANLSDARGDDFLKAWWTSRYGRVQTAQLFPKFRATNSEWTAVSSVSKDLLIASEHYAALEAPDDSVWADLQVAGRQHVRALRVLGAKQVHPVLLASLGKLSAREKERLLRLLEVLIVRYQLIGGGRTGRLEITCAGLAYSIWKGEVSTATAAAEKLSEILPSDPEFRAAFEAKIERNNRKVTYILARLERQKRQSKKGAAVVELDPSETLTVEHILPRSPGPEWRSVLDADSTLGEDCTYRLGNVCLLSGVNRALGNKAFDEKRTTYSQSDLLLTLEVGSYSQWDRQSIDRRQKEMAKLAVAAWRFQ